MIEPIKPIEPTRPNPIKDVTFRGRSGGREFLRFIPSSTGGDLEKSILQKLNIEAVPTTIKKFANGETYINILEDMRNKDVFIMQSTGRAINDNLMETYLKADASRRMGANKVVAIMPNLVLE